MFTHTHTQLRHILISLESIGQKSEIEPLMMAREEWRERPLENLRKQVHFQGGATEGHCSLI